MSSGAAPPGVSGEREASRWVRSMFGQVAHRYDLLNHLLSFQADRYWRWRTVRRLRGVLDQPGAATLDICCGSGDLAIALARRARGRVYASDFCHPMLVAAQRKSSLPLFEADALNLPLPAQSLDLITVAFGFRNLVDYRAGLAEMRRVLKPGGRVAVRIHPATQRAFPRRLSLLFAPRAAAHRRVDFRLPRCLYLSARLGQEVPRRAPPRRRHARRRIPACCL